MIVIEDILISDDVIEKKFVCNLDKCKGACCWEGDYGAPLTTEEIEIIEHHLPHFEKDLDEKSRHLLKEKGIHKKYSKNSFEGTQLLEDGSCVFLVKENGIAFCGIEKAYLVDKIPLLKPISCHLYPVRIFEDPHTGIKMVNYDKWDICSDACDLGEELKVPVYRFVKEALVRKFGIDFYMELEAAVEHENRI
jgi:hypothetical protein